VTVGVRPRRGGRAAGFLLTLALISGYYLIFVAGAHYAQLGAVSPIAGVWAANAAAAVLALLLLRGIEQIRGRSWFSRTWDAFVSKRSQAAPSPKVVSIASGPISIAAHAADAHRSIVTGGVQSGFPLIIDVYILRTFIYFFLLLLAGFVVIFDAFTLFDLL